MNKPDWTIPPIEDYSVLITGDMPGDRIAINQSHETKAALILQFFLPVLKATGKKLVVSVYGGSGVGKSEIGSVLNYYLNQMGYGSYLLSGDNYPRRIPCENDAERLRCYRERGLKELVKSGLYTAERHKALKDLQEQNLDSEVHECVQHPWLQQYQAGGRRALERYLGSSLEIDFDELNAIIARFKNNEPGILLKRMGRTAGELWYEDVCFTDVRIMIIEWTHGNSPFLKNIDYAVFLNSTPEETLEHRKSRKRDAAVGASFTSRVLEVEQEKLYRSVVRANLIISKSGECISFEEFTRLIKKEADVYGRE